MRNYGGMFDALQLIEDLQAAVQRGDRERVEAMVSDRMIWVMPLKDNARGKEIGRASCRERVFRVV